MNASAGIGRLARVLSPSGRGLQDRVFALLAAYFDKSSDSPPAIISVAGYVAPIDEWLNVERAWECGVRYWNRMDGFRALGGFHMADLQNAIGRDNAQLCIKYFANIITASNLHAIGAAILATDWNKPDWGDDATPRLGSVYEQCLDMALRVLGEHISAGFPSQQVDVVFCRDDKHACIESAFYRNQGTIPVVRNTDHRHRQEHYASAMRRFRSGMPSTELESAHKRSLT